MSNKLRDACLDVIGRGRQPPPRLPEVSQLKRLANEVVSDVGPTDGPRPADLADIATGIVEAIRRGERLSRQQLRWAPWCLWASDIRLAEQRRVLMPILEAIVSADRDRPFRTLARAYIDAFQPDLPGLVETSQCLMVLARRWPGTWALLQKDFELFDPETGPRRLADEVIKQDRPASEILMEYGVQGLSAGGGYAKAVTTALLTALTGGGDPDHLKRLDRVRRYALTEQGSAVHGELVPAIAEALLRPFGGKTPDKATKDQYLQVLLKLLSDPRLQPAKWIGVTDSLKDLVSSWLTEQSLRQFLEIIDRTAVERMFKYRRAFWQAVYDAGLVQGAWVAFGPDGANLALRVFGNATSFSRLETEGKPVESGHAVLLLQIGDSVVADWSHNGKVNIWSSASDRTAPRLYRPRYGSDEVRILSGQGNLETDEKLSLMHMGSDTYHWQNRVAQRLYDLTGQRVQQHKYVVR